MKKVLAVLVVVFLLTTGSALADGDHLKQQKFAYAAKLEAFSNAALALAQQASQLKQDYYDMGFVSGGSNVIVDVDFANTKYNGITAAQILSAIGAIDGIITNLGGTTRLTLAPFRE